MAEGVLEGTQDLPFNEEEEEVEDDEENDE